MIDRRLRTILALAAAGLVVFAAQQFPQAFAQSRAGCGMEDSSGPCKIMGFRLVSNNPTTVTLQIATERGPISFIASKKIMEQFAKDLLRQAEDMTKKEGI